MASGRKKKSEDLVSTRQNPGQELIQPKKPVHRFLPGNDGHGGGRPKGSRNKLSEAVIRDLLADWEVAGPSAIQACRLEDPAAYVRIVASLIPKELKLKQDDDELDKILDQLSDEQLALIKHHGIAGLIGQTESGSQNPKAVSRGKPNGVH